jgi:steroid 5-alpha reductase family enzyme
MALKQKYFIDSHKGVTFIAVLMMMTAFNQWNNPTAWAYLGLHGTYGILWVLKSQIFPDRNWEQTCSLWYGIFVIWGALTLFWIPPFLLTWRGVNGPPWMLALSISLFTFGIFFHFAGDMQKYTSMKLHPGTLITDGLMALSRNINYFGELLIYLAFGLLAYTPWALLPLALFIVSYWTPNMVRKEKILSRMEGYDDYQKKTKKFIPFIY